MWQSFLKDCFLVKCCLDGYKTLEMCDKAVDNFLPTLEFVPDWIASSKMIIMLYNALFADDDILFFDEDSGNVIFSTDELGILRLNLNINLDDTKLYEDDPKSIIHGLAQ